MAGRESYQELMGELAAAQDALVSEQTQAKTWYEQQCRAAEAAVRQATRAVTEAQAEVDAALSVMERTDLQAYELWRLLEARVGELGPPPREAPDGDPDDDALARLAAVRDGLERAPRTTVLSLPSWASPLMVAIGAVGAGIGYALAQAVRYAGVESGGDFGAFSPVLRQLITLLAPLFGLVGAKVLADRRGAVLDLGAVGVVVASGLLTLASLAVIFGR